LIFYVYFVSTEPTTLFLCVTVTSQVAYVNKFSNFKICRVIYSHCLKKLFTARIEESCFIGNWIEIRWKASQKFRQWLQVCLWNINIWNLINMPPLTHEESAVIRLGRNVTVTIALITAR